MSETAARSTYNATEQVYASTRAAVAQRLPDVIDSQLDTLALVIVGISQSVAAQRGKIARALPLDTTQYAKEQRMRRLLDNQRITQADQYQPLAKAALSGLKGQRVQRLIDRVLLQDRHTILVISVAFRRRSLPLVWKALDHRGQSGFADQQALFEQALNLLPARVRVSMHGDSEFRSQQLFAWLRGRGHAAMLGVTGRTLLATTPGGDRQPLESGKNGWRVIRKRSRCCCISICKQVGRRSALSKGFQQFREGQPNGSNRRKDSWQKRACAEQRPIAMGGGAVAFAERLSAVSEPF